jgi:hypothetical protein
MASTDNTGAFNFGEDFFGGPAIPVVPVPPVTAMATVVVTPNPQDFLGRTIMIVPGDNLTITFDFSKVFGFSAGQVPETVVADSFFTSSTDIVKVATSMVGQMAILTISNTMTPGETVSLACYATGSLGSQSAGYAWLTAYDTGLYLNDQS